MIECKLKVKNANSGQLFRPDWFSSAFRTEQNNQRGNSCLQRARGNEQQPRDYYSIGQ